ncbi:MAG: heat-inducible transcriptional repressor HrcA [Candidatus Aminicenantaceae bacterium]
MVIREKDKTILKLIAENYLRIGKPISSGCIVQKTNISVSPATVRNIMAKLEKLGYLNQPHTSAGRVPTDKGLRFYVNSLFEEAVLPKGQLELLSEHFSLKKGDLSSLLTQVSKILAEHSDNLGFVLSPRISRVNFQHIRFIKVSEEKAMIILITTFNLVLTEIVETNEYFTQVELDSASQYINQGFKGKNLYFVRNYLLKELPTFKLKYESIISKLISLVKAYIYQEEQESEIFLQGTSKLLEKSELFDMDRLKSLFQKFEEKAKLARLLSDFISLDRVKVLIGSELDIPDISDCALILSHYGYDNQILGSLGIIGPKRIPYKKIIPLVDYVAKKLNKTISHNQ